MFLNQCQFNNFYLYISWHFTTTGSVWDKQCNFKRFYLRNLKICLYFIGIIVTAARTCMWLIMYAREYCTSVYLLVHNISVNLEVMWPCRIVTNFFVIKPTRCTNFTNLFCHETLRVSDSSSVHHQEFIHCTLSNGVCHTVSFREGAYAPARKLSTNLYDIYHCWVYSE